MEIPVSKNLKKAFDVAKFIAVKYNNQEIGTEHILYGIAYDEESKTGKLLRDNGIDLNIMEQIFAEEEVHFSAISPDFTDRVKQTLTLAYGFARQNETELVDTEHMLYCMLGDTSSYAFSILTNLFHVNIKNLYQQLGQMITKNFSSSNSASGQPQLPAQLNDLGIDLTQKAMQHRIDPIIGRKAEIERIIQILCRKTKNNPVLIGEPGVGKSAVVEGLAKAIIEGNVPELLKNKIIFQLDIGSLMAGTKYRGALEEKLKDAINLIMEQKNIIVFIDELHTLAQAGSKDGEVSPADILKPYLARGDLQTIGATTTDEYRKFIEKDRALERRFQPIIVNPPTVEETIEILKGLKENYEAFHKIKLTDEAIVAAAKLSDRYITDRFLPDKAIDLIDEAMSKAKVSGNTTPPDIRELEEQYESLDRETKKAADYQDFVAAAELKKKREEISKQIEQVKLDWSKSSDRSGGTITADHIAEIVSKWTNIPVTRLSESETQRLMGLENLLHNRVVGQDEAVESVAKAIRRARAGLKDPNRPIGTFLFLGPTGVGKTELTKALCEAMYDDENAVIRLDMSEFMEAHSVSKLIGAPPGYVGFDDGGQLTEQVRRRPYSVVLFDEIEKAHPDVYNALLQILDDGRLTDSQGRTVSFKNTIIIMTSNVGVSELHNASRPLGFGADDVQVEQNNNEILMNAVKRHFKPEFVNRIDVITIFHHLTKTDMAKICDIMLKKLKNTLKEKNIELELTQDAKNYIIDKGYDPEYGARPLRRVIEQVVEDNIAEMYLQGRIQDNSKVIFNISNGTPDIRAEKIN